MRYTRDTKYKFNSGVKCYYLEMYKCNDNIDILSLYIKIHDKKKARRTLN